MERYLPLGLNQQKLRMSDKVRSTMLCLHPISGLVRRNSDNTVLKSADLRYDVYIFSFGLLGNTFS